MKNDLILISDVVSNETLMIVNNFTIPNSVEESGQESVCAYIEHRLQQRGYETAVVWGVKCTVKHRELTVLTNSTAKIYTYKAPLFILLASAAYSMYRASMLGAVFSALSSATALVTTPIASALGAGGSAIGNVAAPITAPIVSVIGVGISALSDATAPLITHGTSALEVVISALGNAALPVAVCGIAAACYLGYKYENSDARVLGVRISKEIPSAYY